MDWFHLSNYWKIVNYLMHKLSKIRYAELMDVEYSVKGLSPGEFNSIIIGPVGKHLIFYLPLLWQLQGCVEEWNHFNFTFQDTRFLRHVFEFDRQDSPVNPFQKSQAYIWVHKRNKCILYLFRSSKSATFANGPLPRSCSSQILNIYDLYMAPLWHVACPLPNPKTPSNLPHIWPRCYRFELLYAHLHQ